MKDHIYILISITKESDNNTLNINGINRNAFLIKHLDTGELVHSELVKDTVLTNDIILIYVRQGALKKNKEILRQICVHKSFKVICHKAVTGRLKDEFFLGEIRKEQERIFPQDNSFIQFKFEEIINIYLDKRKTSFEEILKILENMVPSMEINNLLKNAHSISKLTTKQKKELDNFTNPKK